MTVKLEVKSLYKIFGDQPDKAFKLLAKGHDRASILKKTGQTLGVQDVNLAINEGEIFVVMGLSGSGCTSGHGVCGLSRLSPRSLVATLAFMGAGFTMVFVVRHVL